MTTDAESPKANGNGAEQARREELSAWLAKQTTDRDEAVAEAGRLKAQATGLFTKIDVLEAQLAAETSKTQTAELKRDEAIARRVELETVLSLIMSNLRTFQIKHEPVVEPREAPGDIATIGGA